MVSLAPPRGAVAAAERDNGVMVRMAILRVLGKILVRILAGIGAATVLLALYFLFLFLYIREAPEPLPEHVVLKVTIDGEIPDGRVRPSFLLGDSGPTMREYVLGLGAAAKDERVAGVAAYLGAADLSTAQAQELRDSFAALRDAGKFVHVFGDDLGGVGGGMARYFLASGADEIWLQPSGGVGLIGLALELPFVKGALDNLDVETRFGTRYEYKSAAETFTRTELSPPARENLQSLLDSLFGQMAAGIADGRGLSEEDVRALVDRGPFLAREAVDENLVDRLGYYDEYIDAALELAGDDAEDVPFRRYLAGMDEQDPDAPTIALIYGRGAISTGSADDGGLFGESGFEAYAVADAISDAIDDDEIDAILFRVDSPGGSYVASDIVWREVARARDAGKPIVVSMAGTAASGGYFVSMAADSIVAQPGTITGSIGVYGGKVVSRKFWEELGITWDEVHVGERATMWSFVRDFPPGAEQRFADMLDFIYDDFTGKAMADRGLDKEQIDEVARGRVWSGRDALQVGLVDALGGYTVAVQRIKEALGLKPEDEVRLEIWPREREPLERLLAVLRGDSPLTELSSMLGGGRNAAAEALGDDLAPLAGTLSALRRPAGVLQMPPFRIRY